FDKNGLHKRRVDAVVAADGQAGPGRRGDRKRAAKDRPVDRAASVHRVRAGPRPVDGAEQPGLGGGSDDRDLSRVAPRCPAEQVPPPAADLPVDKPRWLTNSRGTSRASRSPPVRPTPPPPAKPEPLK